MTNRDVVRAWKDVDYRDTLSVIERDALPAHPAGADPIVDMDLDLINGADTEPIGTRGCCTSIYSFFVCQSVAVNCPSNTYNCMVFTCPPPWGS